MSLENLDQLFKDLRSLNPQDFGTVLKLAVQINSVLAPEENLEQCQRHIQFVSFELQQECANKDPIDRWGILRDFFFHKKEFSCESNLWLKSVLHSRRGHPLTLGFLLLHLASQVGLPLQLIQARHHYIIRLVINGHTVYFDLMNNGKIMTDEDLVKVLHRSASNLEVWNAKQLLLAYLEELARQFEMCEDWNRLLSVYDLYLHLDDTCTSVFGLRGLLRHKLGMIREALSDLKRYFSFVEKSRAPIELQHALVELEKSTQYPAQPSGFLH